MRSKHFLMSRETTLTTPAPSRRLGSEWWNHSSVISVSASRVPTRLRKPCCCGGMRESPSGGSALAVLQPVSEKFFEYLRQHRADCDRAVVVRVGPVAGLEEGVHLGWQPAGGEGAVVEGEVAEPVQLPC